LQANEDVTIKVVKI